MDNFQHIPGPKGLAQRVYPFYVNFMPKGLYKFATIFFGHGFDNLHASFLCIGNQKYASGQDRLAIINENMVII